MAKQFKINIKNAQLAEAIDLKGIKKKLADKKSEEEEKLAKAKGVVKTKPEALAEEPQTLEKEAPKVKARTRSAFVDSSHKPKEEESHEVPLSEETYEEVEEVVTVVAETIAPQVIEPEPEIFVEPVVEETVVPPTPVKEPPVIAPVVAEKTYAPPPPRPVFEKLGPTGRHVRDLVPPKRPPREAPPARDVQSREGQRPGQRPYGQGPSQAHSQSYHAEKRAQGARPAQGATPFQRNPLKEDSKFAKPKEVKQPTPSSPSSDDAHKKSKVGPKAKDFKDLKPTKRAPTTSQEHFDSRDRQGLRAPEDESRDGWRRKRQKGGKKFFEEVQIVRPTDLKVRVPIMIKDLASEMKLKSSELISKLFLQGIVVTLNDFLDDDTTIQLLGSEFGCNITIDTTEEERIRITDKTVKEEIDGTPSEELKIRPPVIAFMGHVDHGKTSLIDRIRKSNIVSQEAGAITQHIGAFTCKTAVGNITVLDTPGHEAFTEMRARGADVTDIVVLVVAGDEGIKLQTKEAIQHAKAAEVTIVVAINKCDKPNFNPENVYRQLSEAELLPESWGGQTITINTSATTGEGVDQLLEMLALQSEILELRANPKMRARGRVLESEMHKGMGPVATVLVQNGTLKKGDCLVFHTHYGKVKTMRDEFGITLDEAGPAYAVEITGLSGLPEAGDEFIVVKNEREAEEIAEAREFERRSKLQMAPRRNLDTLLQEAKSGEKKVLNVLLRADVQGSLEALKAALMKIESDKVDLNIIFSGIGEISESDIQLGSVSKGVVIGFHSSVEKHAEPLVKEHGVTVRLHDVIYHAIDDVKRLMTGQLDKIAKEEPRGKATVLQVFKSSQVGSIAGSQVSEGFISRNHHARVRRGTEIVYEGTITSLKRLKDDVKEVQKGLECGIVLANHPNVEPDDVIETYDITYITQEL